MATVNYITYELLDSEAIVVAWGPMGDDDVGNAYEGVLLADRSIQTVAGVGGWGGATFTMQGDNVGPIGSDFTWQTLNDLQGTALTMTTNGLKGIAEMTRRMRPKTSGGAGTEVYAYMFVKRVG